MQKSSLLPGVIAAALLLTACETTPVSDSDFEIYEAIPEGPGIISGDEGRIVLFRPQGQQVEDRQAADKTAANDASTRTDDLIPGEMSAADWQEFAAFKRWLKARESGNADYAEFQQWLKYEEFRQWQKSTE